MTHRNYMSSGFSSPTKQRNIMAFVGNGFDIQVMKDYASPIDTRYESFYHFLKLRSFDEENLIFKEMGILQRNNKENWSDVESIVGELLSGNRAKASQLNEALRDIQVQFSEFLDLAVPNSLLANLGNESMDRSLAVASLKGFLGDLSAEEYRKLEFAGRCDNFDIYNFVFFNFNYTPLLDNFIYLDQKQFDPLPRKTVDRNFVFEGNPEGISEASVRPHDIFSSYVMTEMVHPHGSQGVPRSLLFGIDTPKVIEGNQDKALRLSKPFWARNEWRYGDLFNDTELFVIFGCSLGESDRWWWKNIADVLGQESAYSNGAGLFLPELIIYWYNGGSDQLSAEGVRQRFLESAGKIGQFEKLKDYIRVVLYDRSTDRKWLKSAPEELCDK